MTRFVPLCLLAACATAPERAAPPDRSALPPPAAPRAFQAPVPQDLRLGNGLRVLLVERHTVPIFSMQLLVRGGVGTEPAAIPGLATFMASMMDEGTQRYDAAGLSERAESLGASVWTSADFDTTSAGASGLAENLAPTLDLFAELVLRPTFPEKDLERVRGERLGSLMQEADQPSIVASLTARRLLYGDHPMGRRASGTPAATKSVIRADLLALYARIFRPDNGVLVIAGDVTAAEILPALESTLGAWKAPAEPLPDFTVPPAPAATKTALVLVDRPAATQSVVIVAVPGYPAAHPERPVGEVLNAVFGGMFSSRMNLNLREVHGYSYGASSSFSSARDNGTIYMQSAVKAEHTADALSEMLLEVHRITAQPPSVAELELARGFLTRIQPLRFETGGGTAGQIAGLVAAGLPTDWFSGYAARIDAVTPEQILRMARGFVSTVPLSIAVVGDRAAHEPALQKLGVAPIAIWTAEQAPAP